MFDALSKHSGPVKKVGLVPAHGYTTTVAWATPGKQLKVLARLHAERLTHVQNARMRRQKLLSQLHDLAEGGKIAVLESGRDCDGVRYWGRRHLIDATAQDFDALYDHVASWADGPFSFELARPSQAVEEGSRDLALEAFENGHPHVLYD